MVFWTTCSDHLCCQFSLSIFGEETHRHLWMVSTRQTLTVSANHWSNLISIHNISQGRWLLFFCSYYHHQKAIDMVETVIVEKDTTVMLALAIGETCFLFLIISNTTLDRLGMSPRNCLGALAYGWTGRTDGFPEEPLFGGKIGIS